MRIMQNLRSSLLSSEIKKIIPSHLRLRAPSYVLAAVVLLPMFSAASSAFAGSATWNHNPTSGHWNTAANWTPETVPNGPADTATFDVSHHTGVSFPFFATFEVNVIEFNAGASAFTITVPLSALTISGAGIMNNSGITQNFFVDTSALLFLNSATAGSETAFTNSGGELDDGTQFFDTSTAGNGTFTNNSLDFESERPSGGSTRFFDTSTAGNGTFTNNTGNLVGFTQFFNTSTAGNGTFTNHGSFFTDEFGGFTTFADTSTAGNGTFTNNGGAGGGGIVDFFGTSTAGNGTFINNSGPTEVFANGSGSTQFFDTSSADNGNFTNNGGTVGNPKGGETVFDDTSTASNSTLIAHGGTNGGEGGSIFLTGLCSGGTARVEVFGNGNLDISSHNHQGVTTGSVEGNGAVFLGAFNLRVGSNNLSTTFSGVIQDGGINGGTVGSLTKIGTGTLTLSGLNTYTGGTLIKRGALLVNNKSGSGTGSGGVQVNAGTLGGKGIIAGSVTVGTGSGPGAILSPGISGAGTLTIQSTLTFNPDGIYNFQLNSRTASADKVVANGVTISGAQFSFTGLGNALTLGTVYTVIDNTAATPITGTFSNLADGSIFTVNGHTFQASYEGGDGNDLTLTVLP